MSNQPPHMEPSHLVERERNMNRTDKQPKPKPKAVIVGGSIAGISCAHTLILAGWDVLVLERSPAAPKSLTGAGIALDPLSLKHVASWLPRPGLLLDASLPLDVDENRVTDKEKVNFTLTRDEKYNSRAVHWADLHRLLHDALPEEIFLWGQLFLSFSVSDDKKSITVKAKILETDEVIELVADLLVAADGSRSSIRRSFLPNLKLRYAGYCALRGVLDFPTTEEYSETIIGIRRAYRELGKTLYFDMAHRSHVVLFDLPNKRLNWVWFFNRPEPHLKGSSATMKVSNERLHKMHGKAEQTWVLELAKVMKQTKKPFVNVIYDCDPLERVYWDNVVLVGDAAHPTTPHAARSTNMSILDAVVLAQCLNKFGAANLSRALDEYQSIRLPVTSGQVLYSRRMGRIRQGLAVPGREPFDPRTADPKDCQQLRQRSMPFFPHDVPSFVGCEAFDSETSS